LSKVLVRYIDANTISNSGTSHRNDDFWSIQLSAEAKGKKRIESDITIFNDVWM